MPRPRKRVPLETGLKLDLNRIVRHEVFRSATVPCASIKWTRSADVTASGLLIWHLSAHRGSIRLHLGAVEQSIELVGAPRHFGGVQWYFLCPVLGRRVSVLWKPPGASFVRHGKPGAAKSPTGRNSERGNFARWRAPKTFVISSAARNSYLSTSRPH